MVNKLCRKLALERCRMYVAQICAASYFEGEALGFREARYVDTVPLLLSGLSRDLDILEDLLNNPEGE